MTGSCDCKYVDSGSDQNNEIIKNGIEGWNESRLDP